MLEIFAMRHEGRGRRFSTTELTRLVKAGKVNNRVYPECYDRGV